MVKDYVGQIAAESLKRGELDVSTRSYSIPHTLGQETLHVDLKVALQVVPQVVMKKKTLKLVTKLLILNIVYTRLNK
jgi:hypothetical protein